MQTYRGLLALVTLALEGLATPARVEGCTLARAAALIRVLVAVPTLAPAVAHTAGLEGLAPQDRADTIPIRGIDRRLTVNDFEAR